MNISDRFWTEFVYGGHFLSLGASAIALFTMMILSTTIHWEFFLIAYLGTQGIYNYNHYKELRKDTQFNSYTATYLVQSKHLRPIIIGVYITLYLLLLIFYGTFSSIVFGIFLLFLGILYTKAIKEKTKTFKGFKSLYIAFSWSLLIPFTVLYCASPINTAMILTFFFLFLRFIIDTVFYDIKDMNSDAAEGLKTIPQILGKQRCLVLLHILNIVSLFPVILGVVLDLFPTYALFLVLIFFYNFYYLWKTKNQQTDVQSLSFTLVDGEYYYWPFLLLLGKIIFQIIL